MKQYFRQALAFNSSRERLLEENIEFAKQVPPGALVLDAGAGDAPYRGLFEHARYESADFQQVDKAYAPATYVCDLQAIPVEDDRFDFVVFNQVMEHLPEPALVLRELRRVLKPGGKMIYTAPLFYEEHEQPYDFYRYTQFGIRHLMETAGFQVSRLDWLEGYYGTLGYQLNCAARYLPSRRSDFPIGASGWFVAPAMYCLKLFFALLSVVFHRLEMRLRYTERGYPKNYLAIVEKP
jgi:SAM-dependent methyltransferase